MKFRKALFFMPLFLLTIAFCLGLLAVDTALADSVFPDYAQTRNSTQFGRPHSRRSSDSIYFSDSRPMSRRRTFPNFYDQTSYERYDDRPSWYPKADDVLYEPRLRQRRQANCYYHYDRWGRRFRTCQE